jgi:hypothetical protein
VEVASKDSANTTPRKKTYDLNTQTDQFFGRFAGVPFPEAVEANEKELADISQREKDIRSRPGASLAAVSSGSNASESGSDISSGAAKDLSEAIESLPEILARKANLEAHTNILQVDFCTKL